MDRVEAAKYDAEIEALDRSAMADVSRIQKHNNVAPLEDWIVEKDKRIAELEAERVEAQAVHKKEVSSLLDSLQWEHEAADFLVHEGYARCDCPACNCGSWHSGRLVDDLMATRAERDKLRKACQAFFAAYKRDRLDRVIYHTGSIHDARRMAKEALGHD